MTGSFQMVRRYDDLCGSDTTCTVPFPIQHDMEAPINVYYGLTSFNQNTRLYTGTFGLCTNQLQAVRGGPTPMWTGG